MFFDCVNQTAKPLTNVIDASVTMNAGRRSRVMIDWVSDSRLLVSWYSGGLELLDVSVASAPASLAKYRPKDALAYGVDFHQGRVYLNDINRGLEVLDLGR